MIRDESTSVRSQNSNGRESPSCVDGRDRRQLSNNVATQEGVSLVAWTKRLRTENDDMTNARHSGLHACRWCQLTRTGCGLAIRVPVAEDPVNPVTRRHHGILVSISSGTVRPSCDRLRHVVHGLRTAYLNEFILLLSEEAVVRFFLDCHFHLSYIQQTPSRRQTRPRNVKWD